MVPDVFLHYAKNRRIQQADFEAADCLQQGWPSRVIGVAIMRQHPDTGML
jgi:hypothetical protein